MGFNFREAAKGPRLGFEHEEQYNGGSKRPDTHTLHGVHPETGERVGWLTYDVPRRKADKIYVQRMEVHPEHKGNGYAGQLMDEMQQRHPNTPIDHGERTPEGQGWWDSYTQDKPVRRGRTIAAREEDDDAGSLDRHDSDVVEPTGPDEPEGATGGETPSSCSYCGSTAFQDLTDNGRVRQATCAACGGTMSAHDGAQWTPELIGDPSNHPKGDGDPRSGGVGGAAAVGMDPIMRDTSRLAMHHFATPEDDEGVKAKGLPLLHRNDTHDERAQKLVKHFTHIHNDTGEDQDYDEGYHPLNGHHEEHGVPYFKRIVQLERPPEELGHVAAHLSRHIQSSPPKRMPMVDIADSTKLGDGTYGFYRDSDSRISVHHHLAANPQLKHVDDEESNGWFAKKPDTPILGHVLTHEYGHLRDHQDHEENEDARHELFHKVSQHIPGASPYPGSNPGKWVKDNREHIVNHVSTYGATDDHELIAELYAEHHHSPNPSKAARVVGHHFDGDEHDDHGSTQPGEAGSTAGRAESEGAHPGGGAGHHKGQDPLAGAFRGRLGKLTDSEMRETLSRFGHNHQTGEQHTHREHTLTPVKHAGFKGYVEGYEGHHEDMQQADRDLGDDHDDHDSDFDADLYDDTTPDPNTHERAHYEEHGEYPDSHYERHDEAYAKAKQDREEAVNPVAHHGGVFHMLTNEHERNFPAWHEKGEIQHVDVSKHNVYAMQPHVVDKHVNRYLQNPGDSVLHVKQHGMDLNQEMYPGTHRPMFIKHEGNLFTVEGHHRTASALLRKEPVEAHVYDADKHGFPHYDEDEDHGGEFDKHEGLQKHSMLMGADCDFDITDPRDAHQHALRHHDDGVCTLTEAARHKEQKRNPKTAAVDWCAHRRASRCTYPGDSTAVSMAIPQDRGPCPWTTSWEQQVCPISEPGPMALMQAKGAMATPCQTPGAQFHTSISDSNVGLNVDMPRSLNLNEAEAKLLESNMHNAMEMVLRPYFKEGSAPAESCESCRGKGHVSWIDEDPDWRGDPDENPGKVHTAHCDDCDGKGVVQPISDEEIARHKKVFDNERAKSLAEHIAEQHPAGKEVTYDDVKSCSPRCPVGREWSRQRRGQLQVTALSWDEIGERHPHVYGDSEIHGDAADGADGPGIGDAANYLAHERPGHQDAESSSVHDLEFREQTVHPRHIDYSPSGVNDPRVWRAREGYQEHPHEMPPLVLVKRHNVYQVADGHHRAEAAHGLDMPVKAYVADSPHPDVPFNDGEKGPFHRAKPIPKERAPRSRMPKNDPNQLKLFGSVSEEDDSYRMQHQAPDAEGGSPLHDVTANGTFPADIYTHPHYYDSGHADFYPTHSKIRAAQGQPDKKVRIYRALPAEHAHKGFAPGDWVSTSKEYARDHGRHHEDSKHDWPVISTTVPAKHLHTEGDLMEWGYNGEHKGGSVAFKGGHHQEVSQRADGSVRPVQRKAKSPERQTADTLKQNGYSFSHYRPGHDNDGEHTVVAWDPEENHAGMLKGRGDGSVHHVEIDPAHQHMPLEEHMRNMLKQGSVKTASAMYHWAPKDARDDIAENGLDHTRSPHFNEDSHGPHGVFMHHNRGLADDWVSDIGHTHDLYEVNTHGLDLHPDPYDTGDASYSEHPVVPGRLRRLQSALGVPQAYELAKVARQDPEMAFHVTAAWSDVRSKAKRIRAEGKVQIKAATNEGLAGMVEGDHDTYENMITYRPGTRKIADWSCNCEWGDWAWKRIRFHGRQCSHSLALQYEAQSRGMFGREVHLGALTFGATEQSDECSGISNMPISVIAHTMVESEVDPGDIMKLLMAYGLSHSAALQLLNRTATKHMCPHCGNEVEEDARTCSRCGHRLTPDVPELHEASHTASANMTEAEEDARRKKHHHTVDTRRHAPNFGYGIPGWIGLPIGTCGQCTGWGCGHCGGTGQVAEDGNGHSADAVPDQNGDEGQMMSGGISDTSSLRTAKDSKQDGPTVSGVALKAADTNRVLMLQRGLDDPEDPAAGTWELPGGHHEEGDKTSLHAGIREWEEEVGQPFPEGGVVHHTWTSPNGIYQGHVVVIPSEKDLRMHDGRVIPNPDDPKGDNHEQAAWWDIDHARKNPALREELKTGTPWKDIAKAGTEKTASAWDPLTGEGETPGFPYAAPLHSNSKNPASTGWATSEDPKSWTNENEIPDHLLPSGTSDSSYYGMLHDSDDVLPQALEYDVDHGGVRQAHGVSHLPPEFAPRDAGADFSYEIRGQDGVWVAAPHIGRNNSTTASFPISDVLPVGSQHPVGSVLAGTEVAGVSDVQGARFAHEMGVSPAVGVDHARFAAGSVGAVPELPVASGTESGGPWMAGTGTSGGVDLRQVAGFSGDFSWEHVQHSNRNEATLHDQPEAALPSTNGGDPDGYRPPETHGSIADVEESLSPNQFTGSVTDIVASFQATAGAKSIMAKTPAPTPGGGDVSFDFAASARQYLAQDKGMQKSALKDFNFQEQQALINEGKTEDARARNFGDLKIEGTHYESLSHALGIQDEEAEDLFS